MSIENNLPWDDAVGLAALVSEPLEGDPHRLQAICDQVLGALRPLAAVAPGACPSLAAAWPAIEQAASELALLPAGSGSYATRARQAGGESSIHIEEPYPPGGAPGGVTFGFDPMGSLESVQMLDCAGPDVSVVNVTRAAAGWEVASSAGGFRPMEVDAAGICREGGFAARAARRDELSPAEYNRQLFRGLVPGPDPERDAWEQGIQDGERAWKEAEADAQEHGRQVSQVTQSVAAFLAAGVATMARRAFRPKPAEAPAAEQAPEVQWHYAPAGQALGPVPESQLRGMLRDGSLTPATLVWNSNLPGWVSASETGLLEAPGPVLPSATVEMARPETPAESPAAWELLLVQPDGSERAYAIRDGFVAGHGQECQILVAHPTASRAHARFHLAAGRLMVTDLTSANGTFVNGDRLSAPRELREGDTVMFGQIVCRLRRNFDPDRTIMAPRP